MYTSHHSKRCWRFGPAVDGLVTSQRVVDSAELETSLGVNEPTLAEYILAKHDSAKGNAADFRQVMTAEAGVEEVVADRLHALITTLTVRCTTLFAPCMIVRMA